MYKRASLAALTVGALASLSFAGCGGKQQGANTATGEPAAPPIDVLFSLHIERYGELVGVTPETPLLKWARTEDSDFDKLMTYVAWDEPVDIVIAYDGKAPAPQTDEEGGFDFEAAFDGLGFALRFPLSDAGLKKAMTDSSEEMEECVLEGGKDGKLPAHLLCMEDVSLDGPLHSWMKSIETKGQKPVQGAFYVEPLRAYLASGMAEIHHAREQLNAEVESAPLGEEFNAIALAAVDSLIEEVDSWSRSLDTLNFSLDKSKQGALVADLSLSTKDPQPFLMAAAERNASSRNGPPEVFYQMPEDATSAGFSWGWQKEDVETLRAPLSELWGIAYERYGRSPLTAMAPKGSVDLLDQLFTSKCYHAPYTVHAAGPSRLSSVPLSAEPDSRELLNHTLGWGLFAQPKDSGCLALLDNGLSYAESALETLRRGPFAHRMEELDGLELDALTAPAGSPEGLRLYRVSVATDLLEDALDEDAGQEPPAPPSKPYHFYLALAQFGGQDWGAYGPDEDEVVAKLNAQVAAPKNDFAQRDDLAPLRQERLTSGLFTRIPSPETWGVLPKETAQLIKEVDPALFESRISYSTGVQKADGGLSYRLSGQLPAPLVASVSELLNWEPQRLEALAEALEESIESLDAVEDFAKSF